jgi:hypothetical protein
MTDFAQKRCGACRFFTGTPAALERAVPGLNILSSAYGSVRGSTGLCQAHDSFITAVSAACVVFSARQPEEGRSLAAP